MRKKGFTLVELLAVIVILAIISLIAIPIVLNVIEKAKKGAAESSALGYISALENQTLMNDLKGKPILDDEYEISDIEVELKGEKPIDGTFTIEKGIVKKGTFCINEYTVEYKENKATAISKCSKESKKLDGNIKLSKNTSNISYPDTDTFEIIENISGGELTCKSSDEKIATCSITGTTVTVISGTKEGSATLTIISSATSDYKKAQAAFVVTGKGLLSYTANGYTGTYDGNSHSISVSSSGATITYSSDDVNYSSTNPSYSDAGEYTVYFKIEKDGYNAITGNKKIIINKTSGSVIVPTGKTLTYTGSTQELVNAGSTSTGTVYYKVNGGEYKTSIPTATDAGTYIIYYKVVGDNNHNDIEEKSINVTISKSKGELTLSSNTGTITYPDNSTFTIDSNKSGGSLSCTSSDEKIATCNITESIVTIIPGTKGGSVTLTIKSDETANYKETKAAYVATAKLGTLSVTANDYTGIYDGNSHSISVLSSGATITYSSDNVNYSSTNPSYSNAGTYIVYYKVVKEGYTTITGSKIVTINKAEGSITLSSESGLIAPDTSVDITAVTEGKISCSSSDESIATCTVSDKTITISGVNYGNALITVKEISTNYESSAEYNISVAKLTALSTNAKLGDYISMTPTSTSFTTDPSMTGNTRSETLNPSELNLWRVIRINDNGTIDVVSEYVSSSSVMFVDFVGYQNYTGYLNKIASQYENSKYTIGSRIIGYNGQTEYITDTSKLTNVSPPWSCYTFGGCTVESLGGGDALYETDTGLVTTALGTLKANKVGTTSSTAYWLASRLYAYNSTDYWNYLGYSVSNSGGIEWYNIVYIAYGSYRPWGAYSCIRPILTLKSGLGATGSGTSIDPYVLP